MTSATILFGIWSFNDENKLHNSKQKLIWEKNA